MYINYSFLIGISYICINIICMRLVVVILEVFDSKLINHIKHFNNTILKLKIITIQKKILLLKSNVLFILIFEVII